MYSGWLDLHRRAWYEEDRDLERQYGSRPDTWYLQGVDTLSIYWPGNGSSFVMSHIGSEDINSHEVVVEDCTVIYIRSHFGRNYRGSKIVLTSFPTLIFNTVISGMLCAGSVFNMRGNGLGTGGYTVTVRNRDMQLQCEFRIKDSRKIVTCPHIDWKHISMPLCN